MALQREGRRLVGLEQEDLVVGLAEASSRHTYQGRIQDHVSAQGEVGPGQDVGMGRSVCSKVVIVLSVQIVDAVLSNEINCGRVSGSGDEAEVSQGG